MISRNKVIQALDEKGCRPSSYDETKQLLGPFFINPINGKMALVPLDDQLNGLTVVLIFRQLGLDVFPDPFPELEDLYNNI